MGGVSGSTGFVSASTTEEFIAGGALAVGLGGAWLALGWGAIRHGLTERAAGRRARRAEAASVEASLENEAFAPETVRAAVAEILHLATSAGREVEHDGGGEMIGVWARQHRLGPARRVSDHARVDVLQVVDRGDREDRVVVRVRGQVHRLQRRTIGDPEAVAFDERWTLGRAGRGWRLIEFDAQPLAEAVIGAPVIAHRWADQDRLQEQSLAELAQADAPADPRVAGLVDDDADPARQLLDLSVIDGRFAPALIEAALTQIIDAWQQATIGLVGSLQQRVPLPVVGQLVGPFGSEPPMRLLLRDARLRNWHPVAVLTAAENPRIDVALTVSAVRYLTDPQQRHPLGSVDTTHDIALRWTLELTEQPQPWQLTATTNPTAEIPGAP